MARIAFIGLGTMGAPMAGHLAKAGHELTVYNRSIGKAKSWAEAYGGAVAISPAKAAEDADIVISCVGTDDDLAQVALGREGAFRSMQPGGLFIDHTTVSARIARQLFVEGESRGIHCVDAPVTGGKAGADEGTLTVIASGSPAAFAAASTALEAMSGRVYNCGESAGAASTVKMANQMLVGVHAVAAAEAISMARRGGADPAVVHDVITNGHGNSLVWEQWTPKMLEGDFEGMGGTGLAIMRKDLGIATGQHPSCP